jgi:hypothetical protein
MDDIHDGDELLDKSLSGIKEIDKFLDEAINKHFYAIKRIAKTLGISNEVLLEHGGKLFNSILLEIEAKSERPRRRYPSDEELKSIVARMRHDFEILKTDRSKNLPDVAWDGLSMAVSAYKQKRPGLLSLNMVAHGAGLFEGACFSSFNDKLHKDVIARFARAGALAKLKKDPVQAAKAKAFKLWQDWQSGKTLHKSGAAFDRHVVNTLQEITATKTVERWRTKEWGLKAKEK